MLRVVPCLADQCKQQGPHVGRDDDNDDDNVQASPIEGIVGWHDRGGADDYPDDAFVKQLQA
jgi:hypothetical protein